MEIIKKNPIPLYESICPECGSVFRHGHWIDAYPDIEPNPMFMYGICSNCGFEQGLSDKLNYCPNCGSKMDEVSE